MHPIFGNRPSFKDRFTCGKNFAVSIQERCPKDLPCENFATSFGRLLGWEAHARHENTDRGRRQ